MQVAPEPGLPCLRCNPFPAGFCRHLGRCLLYEGQSELLRVVVAVFLHVIEDFFTVLLLVVLNLLEVSSKLGVG